jgi:hypothetical protein
MFTFKDYLTTRIFDYSIHLSFVKNGPIKTQFYTFVTMVSKNWPNIPTRGNCIGNTTTPFSSVIQKPSLVIQISQFDFRQHEL